MRPRSLRYRSFRRALRKLGQLVLSAFAILYFLIDAVFFWLSRTVFTRLARLPVFAMIGQWVRRLPPYAALVLFLVPLIVLEPAKPLGAWLMATGHLYHGVLVIAVAELLKLVVVERLFAINKDKLLTIPTFAWAYGWVLYWLGWLRGLPGVDAALRLVEQIRLATRELWQHLKMRLHKARR